MVSINTPLIPDDGGPPKHAGPLILVNTFLVVYCVGMLQYYCVAQFGQIPKLKKMIKHVRPQPGV